MESSSRQIFVTSQIQKDKRAQEEALEDDQIARQADADDQEYAGVVSKSQKNKQRKCRKDYN